MKKTDKQENKLLAREGYGYIKRRLGLLSNELNGPNAASSKEVEKSNNPQKNDS